MGDCFGSIQAIVEGTICLILKEFKKVERNHKIIRAVLLVIGWLAASYTLFVCIFGLNWDWNFLWWSPKWSLGVIVELSGILIALTAIWFLAKASRDNASCAISLLVCVVLAWDAVVYAAPESCGFLRRHPSPFWFRGGLTLLLCAPGIFWVGWTWRHLTQKRSQTHGSQPIHSD